jgi:hypothetical protein
LPAPSSGDGIGAPAHGAADPSRVRILAIKVLIITIRVRILGIEVLIITIRVRILGIEVLVITIRALVAPPRLLTLARVQLTVARELEELKASRSELKDQLDAKRSQACLATSAPGLGALLLHRDWTHDRHICTGTGLHAKRLQGCLASRQRTDSIHIVLGYSGYSDSRPKAQRADAGLHFATECAQETRLRFLGRAAPHASSAVICHAGVR